MGKSIVMRIDEAPWVRGDRCPSGAPITNGGQLIGDIDKGPWIHVIHFAPGAEVGNHSHTQSEVIYILEGSLALGERSCGPGTVIYMEKGTEYGFTVGPGGVRFLNVRHGPSMVTRDGKTRPEQMVQQR